MKYSIIFLEYDPEGINREVTHQSLTSIIENSKGYDFELVHVKNTLGFVCAVNEGLKKAKGDHLVVVANDVVIEDPRWLDKFSQDGLMGWRLTPFFITGELRPDFACWGLSRSLYEKLGQMDERFKDGYGFDDDDYTFRARELGAEIIDANVTLRHLECLTYRTIFKEEKEAMTRRNEILFREKWHHKI